MRPPATHSPINNRPLLSGALQQSLTGKSTRPPATQSLRSKINEKSLKGWRSIEYKLKANHRITSSKNNAAAFTIKPNEAKGYNYYLVRFRVELLSQKFLENNLTAAEILSKDAIAIVRIQI